MSGKGIWPDPEKVESLKRLPYPKTTKQLQQLLGLFQFVSRFIPNFARIASPLYSLVNRERKFEIHKTDLEAIDALKEALASDCMLVHFDPSKDIKLCVDASATAIGGILLQKEEVSSEEGTMDVWRPIYYFSRRLANYQLNYHITEKKCLAVVYAVIKFRHFLEGKHFIVETDHHALCQLPQLTFKNRRLQRWSIRLSQFDYEVQYTKGEKHPADCLSRYQNEWKHHKIVDISDEDEAKIFSVFQDPDEEGLKASEMTSPYLSVIG